MRHLLPSFHLLCILNRTLLMYILSITQHNWVYLLGSRAKSPEKGQAAELRSLVCSTRPAPWAGTLQNLGRKVRTTEERWSPSPRMQLCSWRTLYSSRTSYHHTFEQRHPHSCFCQARDSQEAPSRGGSIHMEQDGFQRAGELQEEQCPSV